MADTVRNEYEPRSVTPPGDTLGETLSALGMSQAELAERMGRSPKMVNEIVKGKAPITAETALQLERVLSVPASFWTNRERDYRESLARRKEREGLEAQRQWLAQFPVREMVQRGWVEDATDDVDQLGLLLGFFGVASPRQWEQRWKAVSAQFRRSPSFQSNPRALAAWLRRGEVEAQRLPCDSHDPKAFREMLRRVRGLTSKEPSGAIQEARELCSRAGVALVIVEELRGTRVWGATRWLTPEKALLQLSCRYKTDDHLWFSFFHEAAHILRHGKKRLFVDDERAPNVRPSLSGEEESADAFAADHLIPTCEYRCFVEGHHPRYSKAAIEQFASDLGIAPGVVVGRLQHDGFLDYRYCNGLKRPVRLRG